MPSNALIHESSPYLLQHAHNPVNWYPWGEEALAKAKAENKLILISIGYAACHWCHVMERESFEDTSIAEVMNQHFVCVKVDREERPDIDQVYMDAVQLMTGRGGWPLNCFTLPDGRPIHGGTYFQKAQWKQLLLQLAQLYQETPEKVQEYASRLTEGVRSLDNLVSSTEEASFDTHWLTRFLAKWKSFLDPEEGGRKQPPKFPMPNNYLFLLRASHFLQDKALKNAVELTLEKMALGGIYDQLGGGFARYSTDEYWRVPHFEKMLYDNAQLVSLYSEAYSETQNPLYKSVVYDTLHFVANELTAPSGGFYASLDADSEGEEGTFYVWTYSQIQGILGQDAGLFCEYFQVSPQGNWENGKNVLHAVSTLEAFAHQHQLNTGAFKKLIHNARLKLLRERAKREQPGLDDKILTSWNALMLKAYVDAYRVFQEPNFLEVAKKNALFITAKLFDEGRLFRNFKQKASINAFLDDYALLTQAFISLYEVTFEEEWLIKAQKLTKYCLNHFYDAKTGLFFYTSDKDKALIARKIEWVDNVIPASNSVMAQNLFLLGRYFGDRKLLEKAQKMLFTALKNQGGYGGGYSNWGILLLKYLFPFYEAVFTGPLANEQLKEFLPYFYPNILLAGAKEASIHSLPLLKNRIIPGKTLIYLCEGKTCKAPVDSIAHLLEHLGI